MFTMLGSLWRMLNTLIVGTEQFANAYHKVGAETDRTVGVYCKEAQIKSDARLKALKLELKS